MVTNNGHDEDKFFITPSARIVFYLLHTDGQTRMKALKVKKKHYYDLDAADKWRAKMLSHIQDIRDDLGKDVFQEALDALDKAFKFMIEFGERTQVDLEGPDK